jgi:hypothetical protein
LDCSHCGFLTKSKKIGLVPQAVTAAAAPTFHVTGLKEEVALEIVPLTISEVEETEQAIIPWITDAEPRGASPSLLEELR